MLIGSIQLFCHALRYRGKKISLSYIQKKKLLIMNHLNPSFILNSLFNGAMILQIGK